MTIKETPNPPEVRLSQDERAETINFGVAINAKGEKRLVLKLGNEHILVPSKEDVEEIVKALRKTAEEIWPQN